MDGLVTTVGANKRAALETLETIRSCRERGLATICGLSNISFGMPERSFVNTAFLTLAIREGLTMAIANPSQELLVSCALAADLLLAKEDSDIRYIEYAGMVAENRAKREAEQASRPAWNGEAGQVSRPARNGEAGQVSRSARNNEALQCNQPAQSHDVSQGKNVEAGGGQGAGKQPESEMRAALRNAVMKGNRNGIAAITREALAQGEEPASLLNDVLLPAINDVGELFDKGKYFLPQLIGSAEAMKNSIEILEPLLLKEADASDMATVVIATVEGDIHDIGKNLVALMLKNYGFHVIDLGKDVPKEEIIRAAKENHAQIIALSALMTTTMQRMKEVIEYAREQHVDAKVMIGGAVITQDYADEIGADGYSADAAEAVRLAKRLVNLQ